MRARPVLLVLLLALPATTGCILDQIGTTGEQTRVLSPAAFLRSSPYPDLIVEIDHTDDYAPSQEALTILEHTLRNVTDKRSIVLTDPQPISDLPDRQNNSELLSAHRARLDHGANETAAVLHVLYVNGAYEENEGAVGLSFNAGRISPIFLYAENIQNFQLPPEASVLPQPVPNPAPEKVERAVLVHELGHVLGLVNNGAPMATDREDPEHPRHSTNEDSVMYWAVEVNRAAAEFLQENEHLPYRFDANDKEDLRRVREGIVEPVSPGDGGSHAHVARR